MIGAVFVKTLRIAFRRPKVLAITLGLPVLFMAIFGFAFGSDWDNDARIAVVDDDASDLSEALIAALEATDGVQVTAYDLDAGRSALEDRDAALLVHIPPGFGADLMAGQAQLELLGDPSFNSFGPAHAITSGVAAAFAQNVTGQTPALQMDTATIASQDLTPFDFVAPGMMVFAILNLAPQAAAILAREAESGSLDRVRLSPMRAPALLGGVGLAHMVLSAVAMLLMLLTAELFGFHNQGQFLTAYLIVLVAAVSVMGIGMVIAALAKTQDEAANFGVLFSIPASFLSGAFFELPSITLFSAGGIDWSPYDILPTTHALVALRGALTFGDPLIDVAGRLLVLLVLAALWFVVGAWLYAVRRLRAQ